ncbi:hypothetical protein KCP70_02120 [Salmonella enterica subsp. enterica]|nr:hypothetical protein KCP70_02120 [Salmonella enterica subsp. enterica]
MLRQKKSVIALTRITRFSPAITAVTANFLRRRRSRAMSDGRARIFILSDFERNDKGKR